MHLSEQIRHATSAKPRFHEAGAPEPETEITTAMIEAGSEVFYRCMTERDGDPAEGHVRVMVAEIYSAMKSANPLLRMNCI
jgi:hypothetical protein